MKGSDNQEKLVYQIIEDAGNKGEGVFKSCLNSFTPGETICIYSYELFRELMIVLCLYRNME